YANFDLAEPPLKLALNEQPEPQGRGALNHLGIVVDSPEAVEGVKQRLIARGLATFDETDTVCCYARQEKVWVHDPDGNAWEVYTITDDLLEDEDHDHRGRPRDEREAQDTPAGSAPAPCCR